MIIVCTPIKLRAHLELGTIAVAGIICIGGSRKDDSWKRGATCCWCQNPIAHVHLPFLEAFKGLIIKHGFNGRSDGKQVMTGEYRKGMREECSDVE